jgi:ribosome-binding protein aMBF1 (putative translation factor)
LRQGSRFLALHAAGYEREQFEPRIRRWRQRNVSYQYLAQRLAVDFSGVRRAEHGDDLID